MPPASLSETPASRLTCRRVAGLALIGLSLAVPGYRPAAAQTAAAQTGAAQTGAGQTGAGQTGAGQTAAAQTGGGEAHQGVTVPGAAFVTARGVTVRTPPVQSLDCQAMRRVLDALDDSGYRGRGPDPVDEADGALLDYENHVSGRYYETCVQTPARAGSAGTAFARGYDTAP